MREIQLSPLPVFTTARLVLRPLLPADAAAISALHSNPQVNQYIQRPAQCSLEGAAEYVAKMHEGTTLNNWGIWAICTNESVELIGTICLWNFSEGNTRAEVGYELDPAYHSRGLMSEALDCIINYSFQQLGFKELEALTDKENISSIRLLEKYGFKVTERKDEKNEANLIYSLNR